jgi:hypothetical protein
MVWPTTEAGPKLPASEFCSTDDPERAAGVTLYGRFWVTPEATRQFKNLEKIPDRATLFRYVLTLEG